MKMRRTLLYVLPVTLLFFTACNDQTESKKQGTEAAAEDSGEAYKPVAAVTDDGGSQETERQEIQRKAEARLAELGKRIKELKTRVEKEGDKAKGELNELTKELDEKMAAAKQQLEKFKSASAQTWKDAKSKITAVMDDLEKSYDRASERIRKSV
jgi:DNA repair exonuclease SbcCD ATPase subunit